MPGELRSLDCECQTSAVQSAACEQFALAARTGAAVPSAQSGSCWQRCE